MTPHLTQGPIVLDTLLRSVTGPGRGGTCVFLGTVRDDGGADAVTAIEYRAFERMAEGELERILSEARDRWSDVSVAVQHRLGLVPVSESSIAIVAAAPHRADAFAACRYVIEEVKRRLPVWKREMRRDGTAVWVNPQGQPA